MTTENTPTPIVVPFTISRMPIGSAFKWFKNALLLLKAQIWIQFITVAWVLLTLILLMLALPDVPIFGIALAALVFPALSFGMADVNQKVRLQQPVNPLDVFSGLHPNHRTRLLAIGAFLAILLFASFTAMSQFDFSPLTRLSESMMNRTDTIETAELLQKLEQARLDPAFVRAAITVDLFVLLNLTLIALLAYAPLFVAWQNAQPIQAIGLSLLTVWRNILPLIVLIFLVLAVTIVVYIVLAVIMLTVPLVAFWLALPISFLFFAFLFALVFTSYHSIIVSSLEKSVQSSLNV
jgi:hypothetical protein